MVRCVAGFVLIVTLSSHVWSAEPTGEYVLTEQASDVLTPFGLSGLQPIVKKSAVTVRGMGGIAQTNGFSFVSGILVDPESTSNIFGLDANSAFSSLDVGGPVNFIDPFHQHESALQLELNVNDFTSGIIGGAGGAATALFR